MIIHLIWGYPIFKQTTQFSLWGFNLGPLTVRNGSAKTVGVFFSSVGLANHVQWNPYGDKWVNSRQAINRNDQ